MVYLPELVCYIGSALLFLGIILGMCNENNSQTDVGLGMMLFVALGLPFGIYNAVVI